MLGLRTAIDLRLAVVLLVLVPLLAVFGIGGFAALGVLEKQLEERHQEDITLIARTLKLPMSRALERERDRAMDQALRSAFDFGRVYGVYVYDADGELVSRADHLPDRSRPEGVAFELRQVQGQDHVGDYRSMGGQEVFSLFTPLTDAGGQVIGMLQITRQVSEMRDYVNALRWRVLPLLLAFGSLFILIVIAGHHVAIGGPLQRLTHTMNRVAAGDQGVRAYPGGPKEINGLGERFNLMLDGIRERDGDLARQRETKARLVDKLRESEKYVLAGRLAAGVAHELGAPLSVVDGHVQRLLRQETAGTPRHEALRRIRNASTQMAEVVQHLLGFGRGSSADAKPASVNRLVALAAADVRVLFDESGTQLEVRPAAIDRTITVDESRIREALTHLLRNALHAAKGGRVVLGGQTEATRTIIYVEDSGEGVAEDDRQRIFEPFFSTRPRGQGSGLGLAVVRGIAAGHGADIEVYASDLGGAGFRLNFPAAGAGAAQ